MKVALGAIEAANHDLAAVIANAETAAGAPPAEMCARTIEGSFVPEEDGSVTLTLKVNASITKDALSGDGMIEGEDTANVQILGSTAMAMGVFSWIAPIVADLQSKSLHAILSLTFRDDR